MTPEQLALTHGAAFAPQRGWTSAEFTDLLSQENVKLFSAAQGFALVRTIADETELLTLAVDPNQQRTGIGNQLLQDWLTTTKARRAFLEVAADNVAAHALYRRFGFEVCGRRKNYYSRQNALQVDALLMQLELPLGN